MKRILALSALSTCVFASATALAQQDLTAPTVETRGDMKRGLEIGARVGAGLGIGPVLRSARTGENVQLTDNGNIVVPVFVDIGYRITKYVYIGGFGEGAWIDPKTGGQSFCPDAADDCSAWHYSLGGQARFHWMPDAKFDPSIGIGVGYQWLHDRVKQGPVESNRTFRGLEWVTLTFNGDYTVAPGFVLGPYVTGALGQYSNYSADVTGAGPLSGSQSGSVNDIGEKRVHVWASLGIRGAFQAHL